MPKFKLSPRVAANWERIILQYPKEERAKIFSNLMAELEKDSDHAGEEGTEIILQFLGVLETVLHK